MSSRKDRIAADVGGTFTDVAVFDEVEGKLKLGKTLTTNQSIIQGIELGLEKAGSRFERAHLFLHGATIAINTLLERTGACTALVTTRGFRDIYEIGRINRPDAYNLFFRKHRPLIDRAQRFEADERMMSDGSVREALCMDSLERIAVEIENQNIDSIAILFLHSYRNPAHEIAAKKFFTKRLPKTYVTASHELSQEYREFERTSTVAANAYIGPRVANYLKEITDRLGKNQFDGAFLVVQSTGGLYDAQQAQRECIRMLESGPAAGVIGTRELCRALGMEKAIAFDMGGTTAKSGVILDGEVLMTSNSMIGGYTEGLPVQIPMIDIQEVGTGGGSIASLGPAGSLRVGPRSAGSSPGPVCYGLGGVEPTVTDANLILGRLDPDHFLGGDMKLHLDLARAAMKARIAEPLGLSIEAAAEGIVRIAAATMSNVVKRVTTERGLDARDFPMVAFGGAGPLHATLVARELRVGKVIIPNAPGHFSAYGMLVADLRRDYVRTLFAKLATLDFDVLETHFHEMEALGREEVGGSVNGSTELQVLRSMDMRYTGQEHAVTVDIPLAAFKGHDLVEIKRHFDDLHLQRYGYSSERENAEIVSVRSSLIGKIPKPVLVPIVQGEARPATDAKVTERAVIFDSDSGWVTTPVYSREKLLANNMISGPALIEEYASTTVILPGDFLEVDQLGNLQITVGNSQ